LILIDDKGYPKLHGLNYAKYIHEYCTGVSEEQITIYLAPEVMQR
jgi:hypothetical protein